MTLSAADARSAVATWFSQLERAVTDEDPAGVASLFRSDGAWRDVLALTGSLRTADGPAGVEALLQEAFKNPRSHQMRVCSDWQVDQGMRHGMEVLEVRFTFSADVGEGAGVVRFPLDDQDPSALRAVMLMTALQALPPSVDPSTNDGWGSDEERTWRENRDREVAFEDREPAVLVVGAGQAGLATAAWLKRLGIDTLVIDKWPRVGDNWRSRYEALKLHNHTQVNHLPFLPFPDSFPKYLPKDKLANWFEFYADALDLNVWSSTTFTGARYDEQTRTWEVDVQQAGTPRVLRPRHIVMAIGVSGVPHRADLNGIRDFEGTVLHTSEYTDGSGLEGKRVLVVGTGTSAHDVARDLHERGAAVTMLQRSKTFVTSLEPGTLRYFELYFSGLSLADCDLLGMAGAYPIMRRFMPVVTREIALQDKELLDGLNAAGFRTYLGEGDMGLQFEYRRRAGGYYIDVGCSQLIIDRKIAIVPADDVDRFTRAGAQLADGTVLELDAVVLATGYEPMQEVVRRMFASEIADGVGPVWGLDEEGEFRNICRPTAQEGLWFLAGSLIEARTYSRYLALQIKAALNGTSL